MELGLEGRTLGRRGELSVGVHVRFGAPLPAASELLKETVWVMRKGIVTTSNFRGGKRVVTAGDFRGGGPLLEFTQPCYSIDRIL